MVRPLAAVVAVGAALAPGPQGAGIESFTAGRLQPAGRDLVDVSVRAGGEYEWVPGRLRVRGGLYYEPARFDESMVACT